MPQEWKEVFSQKILQIEEQGLLRRLPEPEKIRNDADFHSNDYLGLSRHPAIIEAAREYIARYGFGSGGSRLIGGNSGVHQALEEQLAAFKNRPAAVCFTSGYATAMGVVPTLMDDPEDVILIDRLAHACLVDAARASRATLRVFAHNDTEQLESLLKRFAGKSRRTLIISEALFSMDGDFCPLADLVKLKERYGAWLLLDEAHSIGIQGPRGRGLAAFLGVGEQIDIAMGTLGKALGSVGGFVAVDREVRDYLINCSRQFIFTTAVPGACCAAALAAIEICLSAEGEKLRRSLQDNTARVRGLLGAILSDSPIVPHHIGDEQLALSISRKLSLEGWHLPAIRFPTVKRGAARLRITAKSFHTIEQIESLAAAIHRAAKNFVE
jgi:8-amino-7-oxononanoate synthase